MSDQIVWGPAIPVHGKRPEWLLDGTPMMAEFVGSAGHFSIARQFYESLTAIKLHASHPYYAQNDPIRDRMEALVRKIAGADPRGPLIYDGELAGDWEDEARAIVADLPEVIDPDLLEARQIVIETLKPEDHRNCKCREKIAAGECDDDQRVRIALAALRRR